MRIDSVSIKEPFVSPEVEELEVDFEDIEIEEVSEKKEGDSVESDSQETLANTGSDCESDSGREQNPHSDDDLIIYYP